VDLSIRSRAVGGGCSVGKFRFDAIVLHTLLFVALPATQRRLGETFARGRDVLDFADDVRQFPNCLLYTYSERQANLLAAIMVTCGAIFSLSSLLDKYMDYSTYEYIKSV
jgi:hypothetical protein